jgi:hypothetical protein
MLQALMHQMHPHLEIWKWKLSLQVEVTRFKQLVEVQMLW